MQYMLLIYEDEKAYPDDEESPVFQEIFEKHTTYAQSLGSKLVGGSGLKSVLTATTVRAKGGARSVHDGPFAETKEQLGGYYLVDVPDLDAAIAIAKAMPFYKDGSVEIRPVLDMDG